MNSDIRRDDLSARITHAADELETATDQLRLVNTYLERTGRTAEVTPGLIRLLHCNERAEISWTFTLPT